MKKITVFALVLLFSQFFCAQWRVTSLSPKRFSFIKNGSEQGQVQLNTDEYGFENLSVGIGVFNGMVCTADNEMSRMQVMEPDGDIELILGETSNMPREKNIVDFNFGTLGLFAMDGDDNLYVQNRFTQIRKVGRYGDDGNIAFSPSFILVFNSKGELQYTLGQRGVPDTPFYYIDSMHVDAKERLIVISRTWESWSVYRFNGRERDFFANLGNLQFEEKEDGNIYRGRIDNVRAFHKSEKLLISVAYYHDTRLKYIKVYEYLMDKNSLGRTVMTIPDPKNVLFDIIDDKHIYLWNVSDGKIKFIVMNSDGNIINNIFMEIESKKYYYSKIFLDNSGRFYSYNVTRKGIEIVRWE